MSLPACERRVLASMEAALQQSEPQLASMFALFGRLSVGDPVTAEQVAALRRRLRWPSGTALYAVVLIPLMFALIIGGVLLGGGAASAKNCGVAFLGGIASPPISRPACRAAGEPATAAPSTAAPATGKPAAATPASGKPAAATPASVRGSASCLTAAPAVTSAAWSRSELASFAQDGGGGQARAVLQMTRDGGCVADRAPGA